MPSKYHGLRLLIGLLYLSGATPASAASELSTLFTTPPERQLINGNRYKQDEVKPRAQSQQQLQEQQAVGDRADESPVKILVREEVSVDYRISGICLASEGAHTAWINAIVYQDGAQLDDGSRIKIYAGDDIRVRITAPDGKHYFATSGQTLTVSYMAAVKN